MLFINFVQNWIIPHYSVIIMPCIYLKKLNFHITPPIFLGIDFLLYPHTHLLLLSNGLCDGFNFFFLWQLSTSQKCHLSRISISSANRKLLNTFIWALNLASPGFHYVARCFRGRNAFLACSLPHEKNDFPSFFDLLPCRHSFELYIIYVIM